MSSSSQNGARGAEGRTMRRDPSSAKTGAARGHESIGPTDGSSSAVIGRHVRPTATIARMALNRATSNGLAGVKTQPASRRKSRNTASPAIVAAAARRRSGEVRPIGCARRLPPTRTSFREGAGRARMRARLAPGARSCVRGDHHGQAPLPGAPPQSGELGGAAPHPSSRERNTGCRRAHQTLARRGPGPAIASIAEAARARCASRVRRGGAAL